MQEQPVSGPGPRDYAMAHSASGPEYNPHQQHYQHQHQQQQYHEEPLTPSSEVSGTGALYPRSEQKLGPVIGNLSWSKKKRSGPRRKSSQPRQRSGFDNYNRNGANDGDDSGSNVSPPMSPAEAKLSGQVLHLEEIVQEQREHITELERRSKLEEMVLEQKDHIEELERRVEANRVNFEISRLLSHIREPDRNLKNPVSLEDNLEATGLSLPGSQTLEEEQEGTLIALKNDRFRANGGQVVRPGGFRLPNQRMMFQLLNFLRPCCGRALNWSKELEFESWEALKWDKDDCVSAISLPRAGIELNLSLLGSIASHHLKSLDLAENKDLTGSIEVTARRCKRLVHLNLRGTGVTGDLLALAKLRFLEHLNLRSTSCQGDIAFARLLPALRVLALPSALGGDIDALRQHRELEVLDLRQSGVTGDISALEQSKRLRVLVLDGCKVHGDIFALVEHASLEILSLRQCAGVEGNINVLGKSKLCECYLNQTSVTGSIEIFGNCPHLRFLSLRNTRVDGSVHVLEEKCNRLELFGLGGTNAVF